MGDSWGTYVSARFARDIVHIRQHLFRYALTLLGEYLLEFRMLPTAYCFWVFYWQERDSNVVWRIRWSRYGVTNNISSLRPSRGRVVKWTPVYQPRHIYAYDIPRPPPTPALGFTLKIWKSWLLCQIDTRVPSWWMYMCTESNIATASVWVFQSCHFNFVGQVYIVSTMHKYLGTFCFVSCSPFLRPATTQYSATKKKSSEVLTRKHTSILFSCFEVGKR